MARSPIWELLNSKVTLGGLKPAPNGAAVSGDRDVDELLARAQAEATRRGRRVEDILAEFGYAVGAPPEPRVAPAAMSAAASAPGPAVAPAPAAAVAPAPAAVVAPPEGSTAAPARDAVLRALAPLTRSEAAALLRRFTHEHAVVDRLALLQRVDDAKVAALRAVSGPALLDAVLAAGVSAESVALVARTLPDAAPIGAARGDFFEHLIAQGLVTYSQLRAAQIEAEETSEPTLAHLERAGALSGPVLAAAIAKFAGLERAKVGTRPTPRGAREALPAAWVNAWGVVPLRADAKGAAVASVGELPEEVTAALGRAAGRPVTVQVVTKTELAGLLAAQRSHFAAHPPPLPKAAPEVVPVTPAAAAEPVSAPAPRTELLPIVTGSSAVAFVRQLLERAVESRVTDVHLEPGADSARIRFRIDGICHDLQHIRGSLVTEVIARIKVLADLDITERRLPQDGHVPFETGGRSYDLRVATVPTRHGEKVAIRIADCGRMITKLSQIGVTPEMLATLRELTSKPFGMVLATGPVGSGKTTTLYSCLGEIDRTRRHVMTIEDPIEIELEGAAQVEVNYTINFDFVTGLRAILRQDPDVVLLGEVRDDETARIAVRASMTGLLVYSTLHANDAIGAITTLRNFNIPSHLIANSIQGVIAQRLLRRICPGCKVAAEVGPGTAAHFGLDELPRGFAAWRGAGCGQCLGTGYLGRVGVFEIFRVDSRMRDMILDNASERSLRDYSVAMGMKTLQEDGLAKVMQGVTTVEEFRRVLRF